MRAWNARFPGNYIRFFFFLFCFTPFASFIQAQPFDIDQAKNSVVRVVADGGNRIGSGSVLTVEGGKTYILTAYHNIKADVVDDRTHVRIELYTEERLEALISRKRMDVDNDIALLIVENTPRHLRPITWGSSRAVKITHRVYAIGHPVGFNWSVTDGSVSGQSAGKIYFSGNAVQERNSGGPLLNEQGALVGMVISKGEQGVALAEETIRSFIRDWLSKVPEPISLSSKTEKSSRVDPDPQKALDDCRYTQKIADYSYCRFSASTHFLNNINPEGFTFTNASGMPEWIKLGLNEHGIYLQRTLITAIKNGFKNLRGANLEGANLDGFDLEKADFSMANLQGASLQGASLQGASLQGAKLKDSKWIDGKICKVGSVGRCL